MNEATGKSEIILYKTEDGKIKLEVRLEHENMWLTQAAMAELFQTTTANINIHIKSIYAQGELDDQGTIKENLIVQKEGARDVKRSVLFYSLPVIIAVGYRVNSIRGTQFRQWATQRLHEYLVKGFPMDDDRLKEGVNLGSDYFDEILDDRNRTFSPGLLDTGKSDMIMPNWSDERLSLKSGKIISGPYYSQRVPSKIV